MGLCAGHASVGPSARRRSAAASKAAHSRRPAKGRRPEPIYVGRRPAPRVGRARTVAAAAGSAAAAALASPPLYVTVVDESPPAPSPAPQSALPPADTSPSSTSRPRPLDAALDEVRAGLTLNGFLSLPDVKAPLVWRMLEETREMVMDAVARAPTGAHAGGVMPGASGGAGGAQA